jgi:hypothetical protein
VVHPYTERDTVPAVALNDPENFMALEFVRTRHGEELLRVLLGISRIQHFPTTKSEAPEKVTLYEPADPGE